MPSSLETAAGTLGNTFLAVRARAAAARLHEGAVLSETLAPLFPQTVLQMIKVGEKSGRLHQGHRRSRQAIRNRSAGSGGIFSWRA
jgi:type II secretory pathway component PulF